MAARSETWVCGRSLAGIAGSNHSEGHGCLSVVSVVCCLSGRGLCVGLITRTECGVSEYYREVSIMRRPWPPGGGGVCALVKKMVLVL